MLHEPADMTAVDLSQIIGVWYVELEKDLGCLVMLYRDMDGKPQLVSTVSTFTTPIDHHPVWRKYPAIHVDESRAIELARRGHEIIMRIGQPKGWELMRGGRTGEEFLAELAAMPGVQLVREHLNG